MALRKSTTEREATRLADGFYRAEADLAEREEKLRAAEQTAERERREAGVARAVGEIEEREYAERIAKSEAPA